MFYYAHWFNVSYPYSRVQKADLVGPRWFSKQNQKSSFESVSLRFFSLYW